MSVLLWFFVAWNAMGNVGMMVRSQQAKDGAQAVGQSLAVVTDVALTAFLVWLAIHGVDA